MTQPRRCSDDPSTLPRDTTPTWEVELLISGVAVFAMLQLPGLLDDLVFAWRPRFDASAGELVWLGYIYAKSAALILAATFVIHLLLRAHWIALVGLHSIHPRGVDWTRMDLGPRGREIESTRFGDVPTLIERADNRATTVFALGVILASFLIGVAMLVVAAMALLMLLGTRAGLAVDPAWVGLVFAGAMAGYALAQALDRRLGDRLATGSPGDRILRAVLRLYAAAGMGVGRNPGLAILSSRHGRKRIVLLILAVLMIAMLVVTASYFAMRRPEAFGSYGAFPDGEGQPGRVLDPAHYDDRRNPARDPLAPFIRSAVATGPYVELVVPYDPRRDNAWLRTACPAPGQALACLQRRRAMLLDGRPVPGLAFDIGRDPRTDRPALVAMIDVRDLARGRHELRVARSPSTGDGPGPGEDRILFWR